MLGYYPYGLEFSSPSLEDTNHVIGDMAMERVMKALSRYLNVCFISDSAIGLHRDHVLSFPAFKIHIIELPLLEICSKISSVKDLGSNIITCNAGILATQSIYIHSYTCQTEQSDA